MKTTLNNYETPVSTVIVVRIESIICDSPGGQVGVNDIDGEEYSEE